MIFLAIILLILLLLAILPLKVRIKYANSFFELSLYVWLFHKQILPQKPKDNTEEASKSTETADKKKKETKKTDESGVGKLEFFKSLLPTVLDTLGRLKRKITIENFKIHYSVGSSDPCDAALNYGKVSAGIGVITPAIENAFKIVNRDVRTSIDFESDKSIIDVDILIVLRIWEIIYVLCGLIPAIKIFINNKESTTKKRKVDNYGQASGQ